MPAITAIPATLDGEIRPTCSRCIGELAEAALECKNCMSCVHLRCSGLPEYQLVRFTCSKAQFECATCVKTKDMTETKYDEETTKVREIMAKEESLVEKAEKEANITATESTVNETMDKNHEAEKKDGGDTKSKITEKVCHHFINRKCKHGPKGEGCKFNHPKICKFFAKYGDKRGGCKKGGKCKFFHPNVCWQAAGGHDCNKKNCRFLHPYGFKTSEPDQNNTFDQEALYNDRSVSVNNVQNRTYASAASNRAIKPNPPNRMASEVHANVNQSQRPDPRETFLEIRQQLEAQADIMKMMQHQLNQLMKDRSVGRGRLETEPPSTYHPRW